MARFHFPPAIYSNRYVGGAVSLAVDESAICISICISLQRADECWFQMWNSEMPQRGWGEGRGEAGRLPQMCLFLPKHFSIIGGGPGREVTEGPGSTKQIRLAYLSAPPPAAPLLPAGGRRRLPSDKSVGADQPRRLTARM